MKNKREHLNKIMKKKENAYAKTAATNIQNKNNSRELMSRPLTCV